MDGETRNSIFGDYRQRYWHVHRARPLEETTTALMQECASGPLRAFLLSTRRLSFFFKDARRRLLKTGKQVPYIFIAVTLFAVSAFPFLILHTTTPLLAAGSALPVSGNE